jgi:hypothetical protein
MVTTKELEQILGSKFPLAEIEKEIANGGWEVALQVVEENGNRRLRVYHVINGGLTYSDVLLENTKGSIDKIYNTIMDNFNGLPSQKPKIARLDEGKGVLYIANGYDNVINTLGALSGYEERH